MNSSLAALASLLGGSLIGTDGAVASIASNSKECGAGALFIAVSGVQADGHKFIDDAFARGAAGAVVQHAEALKGRSGIVVPDTRRALSTLANFFANIAAGSMRVVAQTGTNGKTTTNWLTWQALNRLGLPSVRIGTIGVCAHGVVDLPGELTTPDPISLHRTLAQCVTAGVQGCVIETSSHALDQKRVEDIAPDVAVFTNLTRDHLDYHQTMERYFDAKAHLFALMERGAKSTKAAVINLDDSYGVELRKRFVSSLQDFSFGFSKNAAVRIVAFNEQGTDGSQLFIRVRGEEITIDSPLIGAHNALNLTASLASCVALGFPAGIVAEALSGVAAAPGRLELVPGNGYSMYVDYAHTPDALERALSALRPATRGKLWVVFGCGGDRDRGKRPIMGEIAGRLADRVVVTSDNPRTEDPLLIIKEILAGGCKATLVEPDRRKAIEGAVFEALPGDVILIAGKGHEDYQILGLDRIHLSDVEIAREAAQKARFRSAANGG